MGLIFKNNLKIGMVTRHFPPGACGGQGYHVYHLSKKLVERGHKVTIYTRKLEGHLEEEWIEGIHVKRFKCLSIPVSKTLETSLKFFISLLKDELGIIHLHTIGTLGLAAIFASFLKRIPYFITVHDFFSAKELALKYEINFIKKSTLMLKQNLISKTIMNHAKDLFCSGEVMSHLQQINLKNKPVYLTSGVNIEQIDSINANFKERYGLKEKKILLCTGSICKRKDQATLIKSLPELLRDFPNLMCVFAGFILEEDYYESLIYLIRYLDLSKHVQFLKDVSDKELISIYKSADIFILPSTYEGFGIVIVEAWAAKKPVIVGDNIGIVTDGVNGIKFISQSSEDLTKKIRLVLSDKKLREKLIENGRKEAEEKYRWDRVADKVEKRYKAVK